MAVSREEGGAKPPGLVRFHVDGTLLRAFRDAPSLLGNVYHVTTLAQPTESSGVSVLLDHYDAVREEFDYERPAVDERR